MSKRFVLCAGLLMVGLFTLALRAEEVGSGGTFGKPVTIPTNVGYAVNVSDDGKAMGVIFDNVVVDLSATTTSQRGTQNQTSIQTKLFTLLLPCKSDDKTLSVTADVRGFVSTDQGARARLIVCAGDATHVVKLTATKEEVVFKGSCKEKLVEESDGEDIDFQDRFRFKLAPKAEKPVCQVTLVLVLERDTDEADSGGGLLAVDSLDFSIGD
ncbi:hypothetical protein [Blastopirellula marina]|uniref:Lipid/polyisoprenoid-binding YceI-like domain-containing protein n=1 Tax=Blastopirellula marina TaxID=124 RepID=A0A2S8GN71_9BACT|nr:hypothetical protein [Blastopirellula marina]PQO45474.1 hypothetical protein C5Y93_13565 [Blastopirellula marina]